MKKIDIDQAIGSIKTTMQYEDQELTAEEVNLCKEILKGTINGENSRKMIIQDFRKMQQT